MLEWLANVYKDKGAALEIITDRSTEGSQFVKGFGGIGGMLRWKLDVSQMDGDQDDMYYNDDDEVADDYDDDFF
ncbi:translation termination factor eRF1 [Coemansia sp. RSA 2322]|nr:translation termination factor eRF1 [Coemansia sp. RSA 2322]